MCVQCPLDPVLIRTYHISLLIVDMVVETFWCHPLDWQASIMSQPIVVRGIDIFRKSKVSYTNTQLFINPENV